MKKLNGCGSRDGEEIDTWEFNVETLEEFIDVLKTYKKVHLNYFDDEKDLDLWINVEGN